MADSKITQLAELTSVALGDLLPIVDDPAGTPVTKKITVENLLDIVYPVGSIYISVTSTNPGTLFGGTWVAFGAGKTLVSLDSGDTDFDTVEETGGAKTVTLTAAQSGLPAHTHSISYIADGGAAAALTAGTGVSSGTATQNSASLSASQAHTNLQPYIVTYMFKRTA